MRENRDETINDKRNGGLRRRMTEKEELMTRLFRANEEVQMIMGEEVSTR